MKPQTPTSCFLSVGQRNKLISPSFTMTKKNLNLILCLLYCLISVFLIQVQAQSFNTSSDKSALLALKAHITPDANNVLSTNWTDSESSSFCTWIGVSCHRRRERVTALNLVNMGLRGTLSKDIGNLSFLTTLIISNNSFQGNIPDEFSKLRQLQVLEMINNELSGHIPASLGLLVNLEVLDLSGNNLDGAIPGSIFNLSSLLDISLNDNRFSGSLPVDICNNLPDLQRLRISGNRLGGRIPESLAGCKELRQVSLSRNTLTGSIPMNTGNLTKLQLFSLAQNNLTGEFPSSIFNISALMRLDFSNNEISGSLPANPCLIASQLDVIYLYYNRLHGEIPSEISRCGNLKALSLAANRFTGSLPREIGNLTSLLLLNARMNNLTGTIPPSIGNMLSLAEIDLQENGIQGKFPEELGNLTNLRGLFLSSNKLSSHLPQSIFNLSNLQTIALTNCDLSGELASSIAYTLPNIQNLYLSGNRLRGRIPSSISNASNLVTLDLGMNLFVGHVPENLGHLERLEALSLAKNQLTTDPSAPEMSFLTSLTNCRNLKYLQIGYNTLQGALPRSLGNLSTSLEVFNAYDAGIKGTIPSEIGNLRRLLWLSLGENNLQGSFPETVVGLKNLQRLIFNRNNIEGPFPDSICSFGNLYHLNMGETKLYGEIPACFGNLTSLREIYLAGNGFTHIPFTLWINKDIQVLSLAENSLHGPVPMEIGNLENLRELYLSENQFSGLIPQTIGKLQSLSTLELSSSNISGSIPESLGDLVDLKYLDLSRNKLSGSIPKSLEKLEHLKYFNVSFNELSGEIPKEGPFLNFSAELFAGNEALCGAPRFKVMVCDTSKPSSSSKARRLKYILPPVVSVVLLASIVMIWLLRFRKKKPFLPIRSNSLPGLAYHYQRISHNEILKATDKFNEGNVIGRGSLGTVYRGVFPNGVVAAVKVFNLELQGAFKSFEAECHILGKIRHRNLVKIISSCSNNLDFKALVLEYMPNGNLDKWLHYSHNNGLDIFKRLEIMINIASALEYLHHGYSPPVIHCDLKPSNILLDDNMVAHVSDFGIAKLLTEDQRVSQTKTLGTIGYMAPEYGSVGMVSTMADVYSFGILLIETFTRKKPTDEIFQEGMSMKKWASELLSLPDGALKQMANLDLLKVNQQEEEEEAKLSGSYYSKHPKCLTSVIALALECMADLPQERLNIKDALIRLHKIKADFSKL